MGSYLTNPLTGGRITDPHRQIVNVVAMSGVPFSPHDLRRTFASIVGRLGDRLSYYTIKRLLNHRTSDVTQGYVRFDLEQLRSAMQAVEDFVLHAVAAERAAAYSGQPLRALSAALDPSHMNGDQQRQMALPDEAPAVNRKRNLPAPPQRRSVHGGIP